MVDEFTFDLETSNRDDNNRKPTRRLFFKQNGNFQQNWHESGPRVGPLTTLVKGNAMLEVDAVAGRMTVLKPVNIVQSTSLLAGKPVAITNRLALQITSFAYSSSEPAKWFTGQPAKSVTRKWSGIFLQQEVFTGGDREKTTGCSYEKEMV